MTFNIFNDYNRQLEENEICYNNRGKQNDYESINSQQISKYIIEVEWTCLECNDIKNAYNYIVDSEL